MSKDTEYIATLIEFTVSEDNERVDLEACLEVADRSNASKAECLQAIRSITKCLGKSSMKVVLNTLQLLETMCKNCDMRFLYELNNKKLVDALLKVVQRRRDRAKYGNKASKSSNPLKVEAEDKILYLIQLWADTFMMHQAEFRNIHDAYRNLRKDGVVFPERDPNEKFMINFQGQTSPIFIAMESNFIVPANNQGGPVADPNRTKETFKPKPVEYKHETMPSSGVQNTLYDENEEDYDYGAYEGIQITEEEVQILEESMSILSEIEKNATRPSDMKGEIAKEILSDLVHVHKRLKRFIKSEKFANPTHKEEAVKLNQILSACLTSYKNKYYKLKEEQQRRIRTEPEDEHRNKYEDEDTNTQGQLATQIDGAYTERVRPGGGLGFDPKKKPIRKIGMLGNKLAPPTGWKNPLEADKNQNLAGNPDLIDLLNTRDEALKSNRKQSPEEKKEEPKKTNGNSQDIFNNLLDLNFDTSVPQPQNKPANKITTENIASENSTGKDVPHIVPPILTSAPPNNRENLFNFSDFSVPSTGESQTQNTKNATGKAAQIDDDDFFSDIANRKK